MVEWSVRCPGARFFFEDGKSNDIGHKCTQDMYGVSSKVCSVVIDVQ